MIRVSIRAGTALVPALALAVGCGGGGGGKTAAGASVAPSTSSSGVAVATSASPTTSVPAPMQPPVGGWMKGDFHVHSNHSGDASIGDDITGVIKCAEYAGLDFTTISDHRT